MGKNYGTSVSIQVTSKVHEEYIIVTHRLHPVQVECVTFAYCITRVLSLVSCDSSCIA